MDIKIITNTDELLALRGADGVIRHEGGMRIECDVPYRVGRQISGLYVGGSLYVRGNLSVDNLSVSGYLTVVDNLDVDNLTVGGYLYVGGHLDVRGNHLIIMGDLIWSHAHKPTLPEKTYIRRILPPIYQCEHWQERFGIDLGDSCYEDLDDDGCYEEICPRAREHIERLLSETKWSTAERWMLETLRDSRDEPPAWVAEVRTTEPEPEAASR